MGDSAKGLSFKSVSLVGLRSNNDVVLLVDRVAVVTISVRIPVGTTAEVEASTEVVSCCPLLLPVAHDFADPPVVVPAECCPVRVKLFGNIAVVAWTGGHFFTFCSLETGQVLLIMNVKLTLSPSASPSFLTGSGLVEFSLSPNLSHLAVSCSYGSPPTLRRAHNRQGSSASRGSCSYAADTDLGSSYGGFGDGYPNVTIASGTGTASGLHFVDIAKYVALHPGHVNPKVVESVLESQGTSRKPAFPYLAQGPNWNEELDDVSFLASPGSGIVGDALWHKELAALRRGIDTIDSARLGMPTGAGTLPRAYRDESTTQAVLTFLQCLASAHNTENSSTASQTAKSPADGDDDSAARKTTSSLDYPKDSSNLVLSAMNAIESLVEQGRFNATSSSMAHLWVPAKRSAWNEGFLKLCVGGALSISEVVLSATTVAILLTPSGARAGSPTTNEFEVGAIAMYSCHDNTRVDYPLSQYSLPVSVRCSHLPYCLLSSQQLYTVVYGLQQEDIVNKLILYENAVLAEMICRLNHWERCSLPLTALDSALRHKQLDSVAFFLNSQQGGSIGESSSAEDAAAMPARRRRAPKLAPAQVEIAIDLLTQAVERSAAQQNMQYCQQLLRLALSFLHRLTEAALTRLTARELADEETDEEDTVDEEEPEAATPVGSLQSSASGFKSFLSTDSRTGRLRMISESSTVDIVDSLSVDLLAKAVARLRTFVKPAAAAAPAAEMESGAGMGRSARGSVVSLTTASRPDSEQSEVSQRSLAQSWPENWMELDEEEVIRDSILTSRVSAAQAYLVFTARQKHISQLEMASSSVVLKSPPSSPSQHRAATETMDVVGAGAFSGRQSAQLFSSSRPASVVLRSGGGTGTPSSSANSPMLSRVSHASSTVDVEINGSPASNLELALQDAMKDEDSPLVQRKTSSGSASEAGGDVSEAPAPGRLTRILSHEYCTPAINPEPWRSAGSFERILAVGSQMVLHSLMDRNFALAVKILQNLGCDIKEHMRHVCLHTVSRPLRDYLVEELSRRQWLSEEELHVVRYIHLLERLYPCQSYSTVQQQLLPAVEANVTSDKRRLPLNLNSLGLPSRSELLSLLRSPGELDLTVGDTALEMAPLPMAVASPSGGAALGGTVTSQGGYAQLSLHVVQSWDKQARERVLLDQLVSGWDATASSVDWSKLVCASSEWRYHLDHLNEGSIMQCIQQWIPTLQDAVGTSAERPLSVSSPTSPTGGSFPLLPDTDLWQGLALSPSHIRELVDNELASRGVFSSAVLGNFTQLMRCLGRNQLLFHRPHPLEAVRTHAEASSSSSTEVASPPTSPRHQDSEADAVDVVKEPVPALPASTSFHRGFIGYCVKNRLPNLLYRYLDFHKLGRTRKSLERLGVSAQCNGVHGDGNSNVWLSCMAAFRLAANDPTDPHAVFRASIANARLCLGNMLTGPEDTASIKLMISTNHRLMALATLMYIPGGLDELLDSYLAMDQLSPLASPVGRAIHRSGSGDPFSPVAAATASEWPVDVDILRDAVQAYPQLKVALFPVSNANKSPAELQDITLYQLLQGNSPFNADRLFRWQDANRVPMPDDDDYLRDFPHFAHPNLVAKYGHVERLSFVFYLRQGLPSLALITFIAQHHFEGPSGRASMERATSRALRLALRHFADGKVVSACTVFCELLGCDSLRLRIAVEAANRILMFAGTGVQAESPATASLRIPAGRPVHSRSGSGGSGGGGGGSSLLGCNGSSSDGNIDTAAAAAAATANHSPSPPLIALLGSDAVSKDHATIAREFIALEMNSLSGNSGEILRYLEAATHIMISQHGFGSVSVEAAYSWHLVLAFCRQHHAPLSTEFLKQCARESQWLPFICHTQQHQFEPHQTLEVIDLHFTDADLREHLRLAFNNLEVTPALTKRPRPLPPPVPQAKPKTLFEEAPPADNSHGQKSDQPRDIRAQFYSRVGLQGPGMASTVNHSGDNEDEDAGDQPTDEMSPPMRPRLAQTESVKDETARTPMAPFQLSPPPLSLSDIIASSPRHCADLQVDGATRPSPPLVAQHATNIFEVLLACDATDKPAKTLLAHCIALENPVLAVLAACYQEHDVLSCFCAWLCATCGSDLLSGALQCLPDGSILWRNWSFDDLVLLVLSALDHRPARTRALTLACQIFDRNGVLLQLLSFHENFVILNNAPEAGKYLNLFVEQLSQASNRNQLTATGSLQVPVSCLQGLSVRIVRSTLCQCDSALLRRQLVAMLYECGFGRAFTCRVPDFTRLNQLLNLLHNAGLDTDLAFRGTTLVDSCPGEAQTPTIHPGPPRTKPYSTVDILLVGNPAQVAGVKALLAKDLFAEARSYALLVGQGVDLVTQNQVIAFCEDMRQSSLWLSEERRIGFWHDCSEMFRKYRCSPEIPAHFFETEVAAAESASSSSRTWSESPPPDVFADDSAKTHPETDDDDDDEPPSFSLPESESDPPPSPAATMRERAHTLCLQLYWKRQCYDRSHDDVGASNGSGGDGSDTDRALKGLEREVWTCRMRAEVEHQAKSKRQSVTNSMLPSPRDTENSTPVLTSSQSLAMWSADPENLSRMLDELMEDKSLELRQDTPQIMASTQATGPFFDGRGWADKLRTDFTYSAWCRELSGPATTKTSLSAKELSCLELIQDRLLAAKRFTQAQNVALMFGHSSHELEILLTCIRLVLQLTTPAQMSDSAEGDVLKRKVHRGTAQSGSSWRPTMTRPGSQSAVTDWLRSCGMTAVEVTSLLQDLTERCASARSCCAQVTVAFQIAKFLEVDYSMVISSSALTILSKLLASTKPCAFPLAQQFVTVSGLRDEEVVGYVGDSVANAIRNAYGIALSHKGAPALPHRPSTQQFAQLSSLCQNQVLLASHLMSSAANSSASGLDVSQGSLAFEVELLIHAHSCYTSACDMEGIGTIVRTCRLRAPVLAAAGQFQQMIHLLTGVGRYREMLFVFESLVENDKLDLLLRRDTNKEDELKVVLLDFLRKNRPEDSEQFSKVATHYNMWRELAVVLEKRAEKELRKLKTHAVDSSMSAPLEGVVRLFVSAADNFMKKNCLRHAQHCMHKARLAAQQRRFLSSGTRITNLQPKELRGFLEEHANFNEALLVAEAYRTRGILEWVKPVYANVVQRGSFRYMHDLTNSLPMANSLIKEVAARYRRESQLTSLGWPVAQRQKYAENMRELLEHVSDPRITYQLAQDLGFTDVVTSLLDSQEGQFLKDGGS